MTQSAQRPIAANPWARRTLVAAAAVVTIGLGALAWWQQLRIEQLTREASSGPANSSPALAIRRVHGPRFVVAPPRVAHPPADLGDDYRSSDAGFGPLAHGAGTDSAQANPPASLLEDPEFLHAFASYREGLLDARYADLFRRLNLNPDELAAFKHLLAEKDNMGMDVVAISQAGSPGAVTPEVMRAGVQAAQADLENSIRSTLGNDKYDQYRDYEDTLAQRATVVQLERRLSYSNTPLSTGQADLLVQILAQHAPGSAPATVPAVSLVVGADPSGVLPVLSPNAAGLVTDEVIAQSQGVLSSQQVAALREIQVEQQAVLRAGQLILDGSPALPSLQPNWGLLLQ